MSLKIANISLSDFRSWHRLELGFDSDLVLIVGRNATGKTNILEAIQMMTSLVSFKHPTLSQLIGRDASSASVRATAVGDSRSLDMRLDLKPGQRAYFLNGKKKSPSDMRGLVPSVCFAPDHLEFSKGSSQVKRAALDDLGSQISQSYQNVKRDYDKLIQNKNRLLREESFSSSLLDSIDEMLVNCGAQLMFYRINLFSKLMRYAQVNYERISDGREVLAATYRYSWDRSGDSAAAREYPISLGDADISRNELREMMAARLSSARQSEIQRRRSLIGPHADEIRLFLDGSDVSDFASQGQQRSVVLAWKIAEVDQMEATFGNQPLLLLDDVMSELDGPRRRALLEFVDRGLQIFITATQRDYFDPELLGKATMIELPVGGETAQ